MKLIKLLLIIIAIANFIDSYRIQRITKTNTITSRTKRNKIKDSYKIELLVGDKKILDGTLTPNMLNGLQNMEYSRGISLSSESNVNSELKIKYFNKFENLSFISYLRLSSNFEYTNPWFASKTVCGNITPGGGVTNKLCFKFEYVLIGWDLDDPSGTEIAKRINLSINNFKNKISSLNQNCKLSANEYIINKKTFEGLKADSEYSAKLKGENDKNMESIKTKIEVNNGEIKKLAAEGDVILKEIPSLNEKKNELQSTSNSLLYSKVENENNIKKLKEAKDAKEQVLENEKKKEKELLAQFESQLKILSQMIPKSKEILNNAAGFIKGEKKNIKEFSNIINSIMPV